MGVRPGELIDREEGEGSSKISNGGDGDDDDEEEEEEENTDGYGVFDRVPAGSLFGGDSAFAITRYDVAILWFGWRQWSKTRGMNSTTTRCQSYTRRKRQRTNSKNISDNKSCYS